METVKQLDIKQAKPPVPKLEIVNYPASTLLQPSALINIDDHFLEWLKDFEYLHDYLKKAFGKYMAGLAAPQAGLNVRCFFAEGTLYINPEITWITKAPGDSQKEGCLSLPLTKSWPVSRATSIRIKYQDRAGEWHEERLNGFHARVVLHEMDHLAGKLCCGDTDPENVLK